MEPSDGHHVVDVHVSEEEVIHAHHLVGTSQQGDSTTPLTRVLHCVWPDVSGIRSMRFHGSMTNSVFKVWKENGGDESAVIVRLCVDSCTRVVDRTVEGAVFRVLSDAGVGPQVLVEFDNGRVEEFLSGYMAIPGAGKMKQVMPAIAKALARFHAQATDAVLSSSYAEMIPSLKDRLFSWCMYIQEKVSLFSAHGWVSEFVHLQLARMDDLFPQLSKRALLHGDLQCGNILMRESGGDEPSIRLIDYDYCGFGDVAWDIGNHFAEYGADYAGDVMFQWDNIPTYEEKKEFIRVYVEEMLGFPSSQCLCDDEEILLQLSEKYIHVSHVYYCAWALVIHADSKESQSTVFDYLGYAYERYLQVVATLPG